MGFFTTYPLAGITSRATFAGVIDYLYRKTALHTVKDKYIFRPSNSQHLIYPCNNL